MRIRSDGYVLVGYAYEHVVVAEKALGKPLPLKAKVHHLDEDRANNAGNNLVICEDQAYHAMLHLRMKSLRATGNPNLRQCYCCKEWRQTESFFRRKNGKLISICKECAKKKKNALYPNRKAKVLKYQAAYYSQHAGEIKARTKQWYSKNREPILARRRERKNHGQPRHASKTT